MNKAQYITALVNNACCNEEGIYGRTYEQRAADAIEQGKEVAKSGGFGDLLYRGVLKPLEGVGHGVGAGLQVGGNALHYIGSVAQDHPGIAGATAIGTGIWLRRRYKNKHDLRGGYD